MIDPEVKEKIVHTVGVVVFDQTRDKVLVVRHGVDSRHGFGNYGLPAGRMEEGESTREAASRELEEETGLVADSSELLEFPGNKFGPLNIQLRNKEELVDWTVFIASKFSGELRPEGEQSIPEWVPIKDLNLKYETLDNVSQVVQNAKEFLDGTD